MRLTAILAGILTGSVALGLACGGSGDGATFNANGTSGTSGTSGIGGGTSNGGIGAASTSSGTASGGTDPAATPQNIDSMRIDPADATLEVALGAVGTQAYRVLAKMKENPAAEVDITTRARFWAPAGYLVATFPTDGGPLLSTRLPSAANTAPQQGGTVTVQAQAANTDGTVTTVTTKLTVHVSSTGATFPAGSPEATPAIPANPSSLFTGTANAAHAPVIYYPNAGALVPPNLKRLELHFKKGDAADKLFEVSFTSAMGSLVLYTRCTDTPSDFAAGAFDAGACALRLDDAVYGALAESNKGLGPINLKIRGTNEAGIFGESAVQTIEFAENRVDGGVYYWTASSPPRIMRFDFGSGSGVPEPFLVPNTGGLPTDCVGCHSLSRDGTKLFAGVGNSSVGNLVFIKDVKAKTLTVDGQSAVATSNRVLLGSFDPKATLFVAAAPVNDAAAESQLWFHDANTGVRSFNLDVGFTASHPDWSPDGKAIAVTRIGGTNQTSIEFHGGGIDVLENKGTTWNNGTTLNDIKVVPPVAGKNRYNPNYMPGSGIVLYTEASCDTGAPCNGYSDPSAKTWAVTPTADAKRVLLANTTKPGKNDGAQTDLMDTFARATPFETAHRGGKLLWFTVSSQRRVGLRKFFPNPSVVGDPATQQTLWMFALDPAKVAAGDDGSSIGFVLPFQDMTTSNHMAQWTEKIVSDAPAPPAPPAPPPPPPPPPAPSDPK